MPRTPVDLTLVPSYLNLLPVAPRSLLVACLWLAALPALGEGAKFIQPVAGSTLRAGDEVTVRWSGAPKAREMELLLSVDGGRHFSVRLTRELPGDATSYLWRVPRLPSAGARLALRAEVGAREVEVGTTAPFTITAEGGEGSPSEFGGLAGSIRRFRGELWWLEEEVSGTEGERPALAGFDAPPPDPKVLPSAAGAMLAELPTPKGATRPAAALTGFPSLLEDSPQPPFVRPLPRTPLLLPLRI